MRGVSRWASRVAPLLAAFLVLGVASAWAEEPPAPPTEPPQARVQPPVGVTTYARASPPVGIAPPPPDTTTQARGATACRCEHERAREPAGWGAEIGPSVAVGHVPELAAVANQHPERVAAHPG